MTLRNLAGKIAIISLVLSPISALGATPKPKAEKPQAAAPATAAQIDALSKSGGAKAVAQDFQGALADYEQALTLARQAKPSPALEMLLTSKGNMLLKLKRNDDAIAAYNEAAAVSAHPAQVYFNICAVEYNQGMTDAALPACDRAIKADPA